MQLIRVILSNSSAELNIRSELRSQQYLKPRRARRGEKASEDRRIRSEGSFSQEINAVIFRNSSERVRRGDNKRTQDCD